MTAATAPLATRPTATTADGQTRVVIFPADSPDGRPLTAIVKETPRGAVRNFRVLVPLSGTKKHYNNIEGALSISAAGYDFLNLFVGVSFPCPPSIMGDDGQLKRNPHRHRDPDTGELLSVTCRQFAVGRNAQGNLVFRDLTLTYDLTMYFKQALFARWSGKANEAPKGWGRICPAEQLQELEAGYKAYAMPGGVCLVVDTNHKDVVRVVGDHINRQRFADQNVTTFCRRNLMKQFLGAAILDASRSVQVVGWSQPDRGTPEEYSQFLTELAKKTAEEEAGAITIDGQTVQVDRQTETVADPDEINAALAGESPEDAAQSEADEEPTPETAAGPDPEVAHLRAQIRDLAGQVGISPGILLLEEAGFADLGAVAESTDKVRLCRAAARLKHARDSAAEMREILETRKQIRKLCGSVYGEDGEIPGPVRKLLGSDLDQCKDIVAMQEALDLIEQDERDAATEAAGESPAE